MQEPHVVLVQLADIGDAVAASADPLDAQAEGEAGELLRGRSRRRAARWDRPCPPRPSRSSRRRQLMSTSTLGSVNGKNDGRKRMWTSSSKIAAGEQPQARSSGRPSSRCGRSAGPRSDGTSGSAWRRPCRADRRGRSEMIRTGGCVFSITRICTVLVWLRSNSRAGAGSALPAVAKIEILQRIAGGMLGGMFRASKLCHWSSTSGPSATREAQPAHDVLQLLDRLRDRVQVAEPKRGAGHGRDRTAARVFLAATGETADRSAAALNAASICCLTSLNRLPAAGLSALSILPRPFCTAFSRPSSRRGTRRAQPRRPPRWLRSRKLAPLRGQFVQLLQEIRQCHSRAVFR